MTTNRLEAFSDGVIAILITIMVLELGVPHGSNWATIQQILPLLLSYALSFLILGIYWSNHHHLMSAVSNVSGGTLWANLHLLFWLSLIPFVTTWVDTNDFAAVPTAAYGIVLLFSAISFFILVRVLIHVEGKDSEFAAAIGRDYKGKVSVLVYVISVPVAFWIPAISLALYFAMALVWFIPDRRFEQHRH